MPLSPPNSRQGGGGLYDAYAKLWDEKANNVDGGTFTAGADQTRTLQTEYDPDSIVVLAANQFTLEAGTYRVLIRAPALQVGAHAAHLYNVTDAAIEIDGAQSFNATAAAQAQTDSMIRGEFTIAAAKVFEVRHRCATTKATNGFGSQATAIAAVSIYTEVEIWRRTA